MNSILNHALADRHAGNPNLIVDGDFRFWFEGTSQTSTGYGSATMWSLGSSGASVTLSRQGFPAGQGEVPDSPRYFSRLAFSEPGTQGTTDNVTFVQWMETVSRFAGKRMTLSFWAKADTPLNLAIEFSQHIPGEADTYKRIPGGPLIELTTAWKKHTTTVDMPSVEGMAIDDSVDRTALYFWLLGGSTYDDRTDNLGYQSGTVDIAHVKLEEGPVATEGGWRNEAEELALVQRYYWRITEFNFTANGDFSYQYQSFPPPVPMRAKPSLVIGSQDDVNSSGASVDSVRFADDGTINIIVMNTSSGVNSTRYRLFNVDFDARL